MCGITGVASFADPIPTRWIAEMTDAIIRPGRDDERYLAGCRTDDGSFVQLSAARTTGGEGESIAPEIRPANLHLGDQRLSIIDLSPAGSANRCMTVPRRSPPRTTNGVPTA
jgi:asparagine synthetase B (glutamine-hydrolysing)